MTEILDVGISFIVLPGKVSQSVILLGISIIIGFFYVCFYFQINHLLFNIKIFLTFYV